MQTSFGLRLLTSLAALLTAHADATDTQLWQAQLHKTYGHLASEPQQLGKIAQLLANASLGENQLRRDVDLFDYRIVEQDEMERIVTAGVRSMRHTGQAILFALGALVESEAVIYRELGRLMPKNILPKYASFYAAGRYGDFSVHRLPLAHYPSHLHINGEHIRHQHGAYMALRWTRAVIAHRTRERVQENQNTALRDPHTGRPLKRYGRKQWECITWRLGYTTIFDVVREIGNNGWDYEALDGDKQQEFTRQLLTVVEVLNRLCGQVLAVMLGADTYNGLTRFCQVHHASRETLAEAA